MVAECGAIGFLVRVGLHGADFVHRLVHVGRNVGDAVLVVARQAPHAPAEQQDGDQRGRDAEQHEGRELPAHHEHHHRRTQHHEQVAHEHGQAVADHLLQQRGVVGQARDHLAGARRLEIAGLEREDVVEHGAAQVGDHALADAHHQIEAHEGGRGEQRRHPDHRGQRRIEQLRVGAAEALVHHVLQAPAEREHAAGGDHQRAQRHHDL